METFNLVNSFDCGKNKVTTIDLHSNSKILVSGS